MLIISLVSLFKAYLGKDEIYKFVNNMIEENKYCGQVMKKCFKKELAMTKEEYEYFKNSTKCWICDKSYGDNDVKVRDYCHIMGKYRGSAHRDFNINVKSNNEILVVFCSLKSCDSHLIMQELGKCKLKINVVINGLKNI